MKAFLSHSSVDKEIVRAVARELGRQYCIFDEQMFETGEEFKKSIEQGLDESAILTLLVSRNSIKSLWVQFEIEEAWYRKLAGSLNKSLVYLLDSSVTIDALPNWLRRALIKHEVAPKAIARDIRYHLDKLLRERRQPYFLGRSQDVEQIEGVLTPFDGSQPPHTLFISGLPGIGRRTFVRHIASTTLNIHKSVEIRVGEGDSINDICIKIADYIEPYSTQEGLRHIVEQIRRLTDEEALGRTIENLRSLIAAGELPILLDEGGLLDNDGQIRKPIASILQTLTPTDTAYLFLVSTRRPQTTPGMSVSAITLRPLKPTDTKRLIAKLAGEAGFKPSPAEIVELAEYVAGYPPSAYFAIQQAKTYGLELLMREKAGLVHFRTSVFMQHLAKFTFDKNKQHIMQLLANYSPLPLPVIAEVLSVDPPALHQAVIELIDLSLVIVTDEGYYRIADPVEDAASKTFGFLPEGIHKLVGQRLSAHLENNELDVGTLELSRVMFRAARQAKDKNIAERALHLADDLIQITVKAYHARNYADAIEFGIAATNERPASTAARSYLVRAFIQEERWMEAESQMEDLRKTAPPRDVYFLRGFLERKRGNLRPAINHFLEAEKHGRRGVAINRELAQCYFEMGDSANAAKFIKAALNDHNDNRYVIDLWAQIATRQRDEADALRALDRLKIIDEPIFYLHRKSRIELAFGRPTEARASSLQAVQSDTSPPFAVLCQLAVCEIELGHTSEAEELLARIDASFAKVRKDIRMGLRGNFEIARKRFGEALDLSAQITDKNTVFYKTLRYDALIGELRGSALKDNVRQAYQIEVARLKEDLDASASIRPDPIELDVFGHDD